MAVNTDLYDDDLIDYRYYIDLARTVLLKRYKLMLFFCLASIVGAVLYVQSQAPVYSSTVTLHIAPNDVTMFSFDQWMYGEDDEKFQETQIGILQSTKLLTRVVEKAELHEVEKLSPTSFDAGVAAYIKNWVASLEQEEAIVDETPEQERINYTTGELSGLISIGRPPGREYSNLMNVTVRMADPHLASLTANTIAEEYIDLVFENEIESARKNQQFLTDRLSILRDELRDAEQRLQEYREAENIVARSSGTDEIDEELSSLSNRYFEARENRLRQENLHQQLRNIRVSNRSWEKIPTISNHPSVAPIQSELFDLNRRKGELSKRYGKRHNTMIALESEIQSAERALENQVRDIIEGFRSEYELALKIEQAAEETLQSVRDRKQQLGRTEYQFNELVQDVDAKREVYAVFLERLNQDGAAGPVRNDNLWVADPAYPPKFGQRASLSRTALFAFVLSFGFAMGLGILFELTSNTVTSGDDVEKKLAQPLLGYLPLIKGQDGDASGLALEEYIKNPESRFSEALRTVRTSISLSNINKEGIDRYLITSSQSAEGKTSVALSLAASFGQMSKVLVIDGDLRRPSLERTLNTSHHKLPGLSDVIAGSLSIEDAVQHLDEANIDVLYAGSRTLKPLELLSSPRFTELLNELDGMYETIVIDSPPCISVSDAYVIATQADSVLFVVKSDEVAVPSIRNCLARFSAIDTPIAGVLLNQVDFDAVHNYGKYQDYYDYQSYSDQEPTPRTA